MVSLFIRLLVGLMLLGQVCNVFAWNSFGHRLIVQIAVKELNAQTRLPFERYNRGLGCGYASRSLVNAAPWLDRLRHKNQRSSLQSLHYIDLPFSNDHTRLVAPHTVNAVTALVEAKKVLKDPQSSLHNKAFNLRVLLHVVGDLHQPMHAVSLYNKNFPQGDRGGNLIDLGPNAIGKNLHAYWDNGGGFLINKKRYAKRGLQKKAAWLNKKWPCDAQARIQNPKIWAKESHEIAVKVAYALKPGSVPSSAYRKQVRSISEQRIALAGCRLAVLMKELANP